MKRGTVEGVLDSGTTIYGVDIDTMDKGELRIALAWSLTQNTRVIPQLVGPHKGSTKQ